MLMLKVLRMHLRKMTDPEMLRFGQTSLLNGAEPQIDPPLSDSPPSLLCPSACSPFCELFLGQVPDQTPIALCERELICEASFQKYADTVMAG